MTNIHVLPLMHLSQSQANHLVSELAAAHAAGVDLGTRLPHIHAAADNLLQLCRQLQNEISKMRIMPMGLQAEFFDKTEVLLRFVDEVRDFAVLSDSSHRI